jgi:undecaprenyl-diphosphatase
MSLIEALILGLVQGLTEFLPVSSSGHLELAKVLLGNPVEEGLFYTIILHAATTLSTIVVFWKEIVGIVKGLFKREKEGSWFFILLVVVSMIPAALVGYFYEHEIEAFFNGNLLLVGCGLLLTGVILFWSDRTKSNDREIGVLDAVIVGLVQAIAITPGISRSGSTIATGVMLGVDRAKVAGFSFLMVIPLIIGASAKMLIDANPASGSAVTSPDLIPMIAGFAMAFVAGLFACRWMVALVKRSKLRWFAYYCWLVGTLSVFSYFVIG